MELIFQLQLQLSQVNLKSILYATREVTKERKDQDKNNMEPHRVKLQLHLSLKDSTVPLNNKEPHPQSINFSDKLNHNPNHHNNNPISLEQDKEEEEEVTVNHLHNMEHPQ